MVEYVIGFGILYIAFGFLIALISDDTKDYWARWEVPPPHFAWRALLFPGSVARAMIADIRGKESTYHSKPGLLRTWEGSSYICTVAIWWGLKLAWNLVGMIILLVVSFVWALSTTEGKRKVKYKITSKMRMRWPPHLR